MKQLSVIVPCYNVEGYLERCLDSLVHQNIAADAYEVLLIDDGSTDGTAAICDRYAAQYPQVQAIHQANAGQGAARNAGLDLAQGEYIFFVDSDDFVAENCFQQLLETAKSYSAEMLMFGYQDYIQGSHLPSNSHLSSSDVKVILPEDYLLEHFYEGEVWRFFIKKNLIGGRRFPTACMFEDVPFMFDTLLSARRMVVLPCTVYFYNQSPNSIMRNKDIEHLRAQAFDYINCSQNFKRVLDKHRKDIGEILYRRLASRANAYLYYAIIFAVKSGIGFKIYYLLIKKGLLPLGRPREEAYEGSLWRMFHILFNFPMTTCAIGKIKRVLEARRSEVG